MALFSKHCSSHYHHHMLGAQSSLISAAAHSHLESDRGRAQWGSGSNVTTENISASTVWTLRKCRQCKTNGVLQAIEKSLCCSCEMREGSLNSGCPWRGCHRRGWWWETGVEETANLALIVPPWAFIAPTMTSVVPFSWWESSVIPASFWTIIDFYCLLFLFPLLQHDCCFLFFHFTPSFRKTMHWLWSLWGLLKLIQRRDIALMPIKTCRHFWNTNICQPRGSAL